MTEVLRGNPEMEEEGASHRRTQSGAIFKFGQRQTLGTSKRRALQLMENLPQQRWI